MGHHLYPFYHRGRRTLVVAVAGGSSRRTAPLLASIVHTKRTLGATATFSTISDRSFGSSTTLHNHYYKKRNKNNNNIMRVPRSTSAVATTALAATALSPWTVLSSTTIPRMSSSSSMAFVHGTTYSGGVSGSMDHNFRRKDTYNHHLSSMHTTATSTPINHNKMLNKLNRRFFSTTSSSSAIKSSTAPDQEILEQEAAVGTLETPMIDTSFDRSTAIMDEEINISESTVSSPSFATNSKATWTPMLYSDIVADDDMFIKPGPDQRHYRCIRLKENGLQVLLVSDEKTDTEAAAVHLQVGHFSDPIERPGLAHFHEHMLFLGTQKYPDENEYEQFLNQHGGFSNAYTDMEDTNYYFCVSPIGTSADNNETNENDEQTASSSEEKTTPTLSYSLKGALERFAQFFIHPTFKENMIERELRAVDSEYANSLTSDAWKNFQFLKHVSHPQHPLHKFGCGNYETLTNGGQLHNKSKSKSQSSSNEPQPQEAASTTTITDETDKGVDDNVVPFHGGSSPRDALVEFWNSHYHAQNMKLAVVGRASLDELQQLVERTFDQVRSNATSPSPLEMASSSTTDSSSSSCDASPSSVSMEGNDQTSSTSFLFPFEESKKFGVAAFSKEYGNLGMIREQIPVKERRSVKLQFLVPPKIEPMLRQAMPLRLISHLLGHEAPHSLHSVLNDLGFINGLSSGSTIDTSDFGLFGISLALTKRGYENLEEVLDLCWEWIHMVKEFAYETDPNDSTKDKLEAYHDELCQLSRNNFQFRENSDPTGFVSSAADVLFLQEHQPHKILCGDAPDAYYDRNVTRAMLQRLTPDNCMITVINADFQKGGDDGVTSKFDGMEDASWQTEPWYGAEYRELPISSTLVERWENAGATKTTDNKASSSSTSPIVDDLTLRLPPLNEFIPNDFSLRCDDEKTKELEDSSTKEQQSVTAATTSSSSLIPSPPKPIYETPLIRLWHKMDKVYRVPKTFFQSFIMTPNVYRSPRTITACRLFEKVLKDDLNSYVYDASVAGNSYRVSVTPSGFNLAVTGYTQKMPLLLDALTKRIISLLKEMKEGPTTHPGLAMKYHKAMQNLLRETKNFQLDGPMEIANYNSRLLIENRVWHIDQYIAEMEGPLATQSPLTMEECATLAEECLTSRAKAEVLCMGNVNEVDAKELTNVLETRLFHKTRPLSDDEIPRFRSNQLPTVEEAKRMKLSFSSPITQQTKEEGATSTSSVTSSFPVVLNDIVTNKGENNHAVEILIQAPPDHELGYVGIALLELLSHLAYPSAFNTLRTKEQLGYIVSAHQRRTAGDVRFLCIEVQSNTALPATLEERCETWLHDTFRRQELEDMSEERIKAEASAVISQLMERDTKLSQEVGRAWGEITRTTDLIGGNTRSAPPFDRLEKIAQVLSVDDNSSEETLGPKTAKEMKEMLLNLFDTYFSKESTKRRAIVNHVYGQEARDTFESRIGKEGIVSSYEDIQKMKQYLHTMPSTPYWM